MTPIINITTPNHCFVSISLFLNKNFDNINVKMIPAESIAFGIPGFGASEVDIPTVIAYTIKIKEIINTYIYFSYFLYSCFDSNLMFFVFIN